MPNVRQDKVQLSIEINGVKAGTTFKELKTNARDLTRELDKLAPGTDAFIKKTQELQKANNVLATIRKETVGIAHGTNALTNIWKQGAIAATAFFGTQRIIQWGKELVSWALKGTAALEAQQRKTAIVFGEAIDIVQDAAAINAQALGVTETAYASLAAQIGDILIPMGFQREEAANVSAELVNLSGALSEWSNGQRSAEEVSRILAKALTGERESLKELGIVILDADVKARLLANGTDKLTGAALQQAKAQANLQLIMEKSRDAQTSFAINQDSIARSSNRFSAAMAQIKENILKGLQPAFTLLGNTLADVVAPLKRQSDLTGELQAQFNVQIETLKRGNISQDNRRKLIEQINAKYKEYLPNLITEKTSLAEISAIQDDVNKKFTQRILLLATEESLRDVSKELIKAKTEELDIAQKQIAAEIELAKFDINKVGKGREGQDQAFIKAASAAQGYTDALEANKKKQDELQGQFEETAKAAQQLGLDLNAILNPDTPIINPDDDPTDPDKKLKAALKRIEDLFNKERQLKIRSIEFLRENELQYNAERERINIEADIKIARAQSQIYKDGSLENLKLLQDATDKEADIRKNAVELSLAQRTQQIESERDLRIIALREQITDEEDLAAQIELVHLQSAQNIAQARLATLRENTPEYVALAAEIAEREQEIARKQMAESLRLTEEGLNIRRDLAIQALDGMKLTEDDYQKARERVNLETDIAILQTRIALYAKDTAERLALETELADKIKALNGTNFLVDADFASAGGSSTSDDKKVKDEKFEKAKNDVADFTGELADKQLAIEANRIDQQLQLELDAIDRIAEARRKAAGDDAVELKKIDAQVQRDKEKAEKKAAEQRKKLAIKEAIINGALAVVKALPNFILAAAVAVTTAAQVAEISSQTFAKGGHTGKKGAYRDHTGHEVAGVVHTNEYVIPKNVLDDPSTTPVVNYLERIRRAKGGYADGGFTSVNTRPVLPSSVASGSSSIDNQKLDQMINKLDQLIMVARAWPSDIKAHVVLTDLEKKSAELNYIREQSVV